MASEAKQEVPVVAQDKKKRALLQFILRQVIEFKGWEVIFKTLFAAFVIWGIYVLSIIYEYHTSDQFANAKKFHISDFKISFLFAIMFFLYRKIVEFLFADLVKRNLDVDKFPTEEERVERSKKACKWIMCILYYSASTTICYFLFKNQFFFPPMLGGEGSCPDIFKYLPEAPEIPYGQIFYMVQFGCHLHTLLDHIIFKFREPKFWEMFLHHSVAVFLIFFSYMSNEMAVGILVLFVHDPGDIFLDAVRFYNDLKIRNDIGVFMLYVSFMGVWCYFRLYSFPVCIVGEAINTLLKLSGQSSTPFLYPAYKYLVAMLCALVVLHLYWFAFIVRIALNIAMKKKEYNTYDNKKKAKKEG